MFNFAINRQFVFASTIVLALTGCATSKTPVSTADTIAGNPQLSTLNGLIVKAGLVDTLKGPGPFTVFAPSNEAFSKVPAKTLADIGADPARLKAVLTYHVIPAKVMAADVKSNSNVKTVNGANVGVSKAGEFVTVEDGMVERADLNATNGVVHIIDSVLIPPAPAR
jgi:uncharacterized surface protein with fasciclin (FAS1) repeats